MRVSVLTFKPNKFTCHFVVLYRPWKSNMLSPRTMSLRAKNRALLKALEKCTDISVDNTPRAHGLKFDDDKHSGFDESLSDSLGPLEFNSGLYKHISEEDLRPRKPLQWQNSCIPRHKSETNIIFHQNKHVNSIAQNKDVQNKSSTLNQNEKYLNKLSPQRRTPLGSTDDLRAIVEEIMSDMKASKPHKTASLVLTRKSSESRNSSKAPMKSLRGKSISLQQQYAAEAQMHAPTHSHLLSKCSCTDLGKTKTHPGSKYIVQLYGHKQRIPTRLKKQRYRADSISRPPRTVKWADTDDPIFFPTNSRIQGFPSLSQSHEDLKAGGDFSEFHERSSSKQVNSDCDETQSKSSFLDRVKTFRESHWDDCHASPRGDVSPEHECVHHYVLNRRLFLEPVHTVNGESRCPVCTLGSHPHQQRPHCHDRGPWTCLRPTNHPSKIMVTLPTVLLEDRHSSLKSNPDASSIRKKMREKRKGRSVAD